MNSEIYHEFGGRLISEAQLTGLTLKLCLACHENSSCEVIELRQDEDTGNQSIIVDFADGTFEASNPAGISRVERLAITYRADGVFPLEVRALRKDFPLTSFRQHTKEGEPKILCLYLAPWKAVERTWTSELFIKRILWWLRETADGTIQSEDQPGEQVFFASRYSVVLPRDFLDGEEPKKLVFEEVQNKKRGEITYIGQYLNNAEHVKTCCSSLTLFLDPVDSGPMEEAAGDLGVLHDKLIARNCDLLGRLKEVVAEQIKPEGIESSDGELVLLILVIPRLINGESRGYELQGFLVNAEFCDLGEKLSVLLQSPADKKYYGETPLLKELSEDWRDIELELVNIRTYPDEKTIRSYSGLDPEDSGPVGIIAGVGALGGTLAEIWGTECWGDWTYVDSDTIQPHNIARHIATHHAIGHPKAKVVSRLVNTIHQSTATPLDSGYVTDIEADSHDMHEVIEKASLLVDVTTTVHVPRIVARRDDFPRTASLFLTPSGSSSVLLLESGEREIRCNHLEAQYFRAILSSEWGESHLKNHLGKYSIGAGCREVTVALSNEVIHIHGGNLARQLRAKIASPEANICIWEYHDVNGATVCHDVVVNQTHSSTVGSWEVIWDDGFLNEAKVLRSSSLPSETGGVLLGIVDQCDATITLVKACPSPPGSEEDAANYTRAGYETDAFMKDCLDRTAGIVSYVGEWHSHPDGVAPLPSKCDEEQYAFIHAALSHEGQPALMMIVSEDSIGFYIDGGGTVLK